eukprot:CAMPEP_0183292768 /NCGR_PEP_ID=MMETSP0160_2-20130417/1709_1 /TAXON_ID=2839 ORGANISM="Odontella Sinensis, Strain Grunow 1884" /NCGR_SAMPLE_ID=MMETSP0160_2 /ASSEMBLY_ACC=CAM_ASM_000250 /LENGTH=111 /DNA_ID=CAMNT_0025453775 /DNA_START=111 /DNA_END=446 /DNA_ORIENTATION=+
MTFVGGKLSFKGEKKRKKAKKKSQSSKHHSAEKGTEKRRDENPDASHDRDSEDEMTEAERRAMKFKLERERKDLEKIAQQSHRERVEGFSEKLGNLTEHNDIPRVSAAGNG